uniref:Uncharacterized protein n=1 Tax=Knipowitschia caucasica TaxID=637954 RepID=A0AAV2JC92_KNICA
MGLSFGGGGSGGVKGHGGLVRKGGRRRGREPTFSHTGSRGLIRHHPGFYSLTYMPWDLERLAFGQSLGPKQRLRLQSIYQISPHVPGTTIRWGARAVDPPQKQRQCSLTPSYNKIPPHRQHHTTPPLTRCDPTTLTYLSPPPLHPPQEMQPNRIRRGRTHPSVHPAHYPGQGPEPEPSKPAQHRPHPRRRPAPRINNQSHAQPPVPPNGNPPPPRQAQPPSDPQNTTARTDPALIHSAPIRKKPQLRPPITRHRNSVRPPPDPDAALELPLKDQDRPRHAPPSPRRRLPCSPTATVPGTHHTAPHPADDTHHPALSHSASMLGPRSGHAALTHPRLYPTDLAPLARAEALRTRRDAPAPDNQEWLPAFRSQPCP